MNESELSRIDDSKYNGVITPIKRKKKTHENPLIIGFNAKASYSNGKPRALFLDFYMNDVAMNYHIEDYWQTNTSLYKNDRYDIEVLIKYIFQCLTDLKLSTEIKNVYLVTYNGNVTLSHFDLPKSVAVKPIGKGLCIEGKINSAVLDKNVTLRIIDLKTLIDKNLDEISGYVGINRNCIKEACEKLFGPNSVIPFLEGCTVLDAQIVFEVYNRMRSHFLKKHNVDLLNFYTLPSQSSYVFRRDYIENTIVKSKVIRLPRKQSKLLCDGNRKFYDTVQKSSIFDGDLNVRRYSLLAYNGARIETFCRGRFQDEDLIYYDVDSLYPSSAILQPLPLANTHWIKYSNRNHEKFLNKAEGFVEVEFKYSDNTFYPCIPVSGVRDGILYFPLSGTTYCSVVELRMAIKLGLKDYRVISGYGFYPTRREVKHPLSIFIRDLLNKKRQSERGSLEYIIYKMMMNSFVGKLAQRDKNNNMLAMMHEGSITRCAYGKINKFKKSTVGSLWYPEWASLILGKARAIMSEFICKGTYFISSDSVLLPAKADIKCDSLKELQSVGSDLRKEFAVDHGVIIRSRLYALNPLNDDPKLRHLARHAVSCSPERFREIIIDGFETRSLPDLSFVSEKQIKYEKSMTEGKLLNSMERKESTIELKWDGKRRLLEQVENPFRDFSWSEALNEKEIIYNEMRRPPKEKPGRKAEKKLDTELQRKINSLFNLKKRQVEIAQALGVSRGYVSKVCKNIRNVGESKLYN